ncbi:MAG: VWA domain-containing protein [Bacteroidota bacterium]|jgi:hypothetical protein|nr:VWA domain-containing protein [Bacteroidota bacterium]
MLRFILVLALITPAALPAQDVLSLGGLDAAGYPEIRMALRLVRGGQVVYPLDAGRIITKENGRLIPNTVTCAAPLRERPSVAIGFERSLDANFPKAMTAARAFLERVEFTNDGAEASLWSFATTVDAEVAMTRDSLRLRRALDALSAAAWPFNGTALYESMHRAIEDVNAMGTGGRKAIVFFTDGYNNTALYGRSWDDVRGRAAVDGIRIYVVLVKNRDEGEQAMRTLAEASGGFMVDGSDPNAVDSVYAALVAPDPARQWCEVRFRSPLCANGTLRRVDVGYLRSPADTLWAEVGYQAPWNPADLQPLSVWCSPPAPLPGDTVPRVAIGVRLDAGWQPPGFSIALPLGGMRVTAEEAGAWPLSMRIAGDSCILDVTPPGSGLTDGYHTLARLVLEGIPPREAWQPVLLADASGCLRLEHVTRPASAAVALDTTRTGRRETAALELRMHPSDIPEGAQRLDLEIAVDTALARFDADEPWRGTAFPDGWTVRASRPRVDGASELLELTLAGPARDESFDAGALRITVGSDPAYLIPVTIRSARVNLHAAAVMEPGLLVIRDSCRNNLVALAGLSPAQPWPQPARDILHLRLTSPDPRHLSLRILDALGREAMHLPARPIVAGTTDIQIDVSGLQPGRYTMHYITAQGGTTRSFLILR